MKLSKIMDAFDMAMDDLTFYLDTQTGEVAPVSGSDWGGDDVNEELSEEIENDETGRFLELPSKFDIHEWEIMNQFVKSQRDEKATAELNNAIRGRGAFRMFKDTAARLGLLEKWYEFEHETYKQMAKDWCEEHELEFEDDVPKRKKK